MDNGSEVFLPTSEEKEHSISLILDQAMPRPTGLARELAEVLRTVSVRTLFFGVEDCVFLAVLAGLLCYLTLAFGIRTSAGPVLFLVSPAFYAFLQLLTAWKESQSGTLEWRQTCFVSLGAANALRMLFFGGAAVLICVPANVVLWLLAEEAYSLGWMLGISFSSLFLYGAAALACQSRRALLLPPVLWGCVSLLFMCWREAERWLLHLPAYVFFLAAAGALALYLLELKYYVTRQFEEVYVPA